MTRKAKVLIGAMVFICSAVGYGVYWWLESSTIYENPLAGAPLDDEDLLRVKAALKEAKEKASAVLKALPEDKRIDCLLALTKDEKEEVRLFAIEHMRPLRDAPRIRAELVRLAQSDPKVQVREAASKALAPLR